MAVYKRQYQRYRGTLTPRRSRFLVLPRYALAESLNSRLLVAFLLVSFLPILVEMAIVYLLHNPAARALIGLVNLTELVRLDTEFFLKALSTQCFFGFILVAWIGPGLVAADLKDGALPLYLSRPFSRPEYIVGKATVLVTLTSLVTWIPGILLYAVSAALSNATWWFEHLRVLFAFVVGAWVWIFVMTLFALAVSAWVKWRLLASATLFGIYFVTAGLGEALAAALGTPWGKLLNLGYAFDLVWARLFGAPDPGHGLPLGAAWLLLGVLCVASHRVLCYRLRAREVVA